MSANIWHVKLWLGQVGWCCRIHWLLLCRGVKSTTNECPDYDTKQSDGEVSVMLAFWGIQSTPLLPLLPGSLWPRVVAPERVLYKNQMEVNCNFAKLNYLKLNAFTFNSVNKKRVLMLNWIAWNRTVWSFNCV